jgi:hypothetical protein
VRAVVLIHRIGADLRFPRHICPAPHESRGSCAQYAASPDYAKSHVQEGLSCDPSVNFRLVLVTFPFSDLSEAKLRPAVVLAALEERTSCSVR